MSLVLMPSSALASGLSAFHAAPLVKQVGYEERLRALVQDQGDFVARSLRNLGVAGGELDDCVQSVFLVLAKRLSDIHPAKERAFLFACCQNTAAHFRRSLARKREVSDEILADRASRDATPDLLTEQKRNREILDQLLGEMDESLRSVFILFEFEEMTMAEIAEVLELPQGTVASRIRRAREAFKKGFVQLRQQRQESA